MLEGLIEISISIILSFYGLKYNSFSETFSSVGTYTMLFSLVFFFGITIYTVSKPKFLSPTWYEKYAELFNGIQIYNARSRQFVIVFIVRRIIFVGILCFLKHSYF